MIRSVDRTAICLALSFLVALSACGPSIADPAFVSTNVELVSDDRCTGKRCVVVTAPVEGSRDGQGSCALFGPGDPETMKPLARDDSLIMTPGKDVVWIVELTQEPADMGSLNAVCEPMIEG